MHPLHLGPAVLLGLSSLSCAFALPTQEQSNPSGTGSQVSTSSSNGSEIVNAVENVTLAGVPKLTPDNTCGNAGHGKSKGYTCDRRRIGGGACCSPYVSPPFSVGLWTRC